MITWAVLGLAAAGLVGAALVVAAVVVMVLPWALAELDRMDSQDY